MIAIYKRFWQWNWAQQWQYRANLLMYLAYWVVSPVVYLAIWTTVANAQGSVNGMTANDFAAYYLTLLPVDIITSAITVHILAYRIQDGTVSNDLLQPVHPILTNVLVNNIAFKALQIIVFVPVWIALALLFRPTFGFTPASLALTLPALVMGFLLNFLMDSMITLVAFWTTRVWAIHQFNFAIMQLLNGAFVPLALMPGWTQNLAQFLPYQLWMYFPIQLALNKLPPEKIALNFGLQAFWLVVFYLLFSRMWRAAVKRFSAVGA